MTDSVIKTNGFTVGKANDLGDFDVAKKCADMLTKHYPNYAWGVNVNSETGMVQVRNLTLSGEWGFNLHLSKVVNDVDLKLVRDAGGEILERFKVRRGIANENEIDGLKKNFMGLYMPDTVGAK